MSDVETDFAAFEATANAEPETAKPEAATTDDTLELTKDQQIDETDTGGDDTGDDTGEAEQGRRRSKPMTQRISELTARLRETERQLEAERSGKAAPAETELPPRPNPEDFDLGEFDTEYIEKLTDWKMDVRDAERTKAAEAGQSHQSMLDTINTGVAKAETDAKAKYDDFDAKIAEAVEARGGEALPPLLTIGIGVSPVGGDILYRLATDEAASTRLERLAKGGAATSNAMAIALGELEGEYLDDDSDADLDLTDNLDMARMMGRMRARLKGSKAPAKATVSVTNAPEPPQQRARGGSGQFTADPATTDFATFERLAAKR